MRTLPWLLATPLLVSQGVSAQSMPAEAARSGATPPRVERGDAVAFVREFDAAREGAELRVVYTENGPGGRATLRSALLRAEGDALVRARPDVTLAPDARTVALAWSGGRGAVVYVVPRRPPPPAAPGERRRRRAPAVGVPPSTRDPLGPSDLSGGEIRVQRLGAQGEARGAPVTVFSENARLSRVAAAWSGERLVVAWTGGAVTDDEVRVTVRARALDANLAPTRAAVTGVGVLGDIGDTLRVTPDPSGATLWVSASHCAAMSPVTEGLTPPSDPSERISPARRSLMPQQEMHDAPGAPIACDPLSLYRVRLGAGGEVRSREALTPLARDVAAAAGEGWIVASRGESGVSLARARFEGAGASLRALDGAPWRAVVAPPRPQDLSLREPAATDAELVDAPVAPPDRDRFDPSTVALVAATAAGDLVAVAEGRAVLHAVPRDGAPRVLSRAPRGVAAIEVLDGATPWLLAREGQWSGALRWTTLDAPPADWREVSPVPPRAAPPQRYPTTAPYVWDEAFARLWTRARAARGLFMRHENTAGAMAARPEAPTDPRMPAVLAARGRLRNRWEGACAQLRARATQLARQGAGQDILRGVQQLCEVHPDLQLGVPVNPAL
ncbi:MAG: hypothetical protein R3A48_23140 [Polyangiales bacterium]